MKRFTGTVKTVGADKLPDVSPLTQPQTPVNVSTMTNLTGVMGSIKKEDGSPLLTVNEITTLSNLSFDNGEKMLDMNDRYFIYEIVNILHELGYEKTYEYLNSLRNMGGSKREMLFDNPLLTPAKDKLSLDMEIFRNKVDVTHGDVDCRKCGSDNTISVQKQMRSADEPMTTFVTCQQCGNKWKE